MPECFFSLLPARCFFKASDCVRPVRPVGACRRLSAGCRRVSAPLSAPVGGCRRGCRRTRARGAPAVPDVRVRASVPCPTRLCKCHLPPWEGRPPGVRERGHVRQAHPYGRGAHWCQPARTREPLAVPHWQGERPVPTRCPATRWRLPRLTRARGGWVMPADTSCVCT